MPNVTKDDTKESFLKKCFHATKQEGKPESQRVAQCLNMWKEAKKHKESKGCFDCMPCWEEFEKSGGFYITLE